MAETARPEWQGRLRRGFDQIGPVRLAVTALILLAAIAVARFNFDLPYLSGAERELYDRRFTQNADRVIEQDSRITLITYTDETLELLRKRSPLDRRMLADAIRAIDAMNPRAVGIDILIDQPQAEDPELIAALRAVRHPTYLGFATVEHNEGYILPRQERFLRSFFAQIRNPNVRLASIRVRPDDSDGVMRHWPDRPANLPPLLVEAMAPGHAAFANYTGSIDFRVPGTADETVPMFTDLQIHVLTEFAEAMRPMIEGRYVLIGGNINDVDDFNTPTTIATGRPTKGLEVHAQMLAQMLDGRMARPIPGWALWIAAVFVVALGALTGLLELRGWRLALVLIAQLAALYFLPIYLQRIDIDTVNLPAFGWALGWGLGFLAILTAARAIGAEQRRFAYAALGKYLPVDIANEILRNPEKLALSGEKRQIFALFTDLEGFTKLSHSITPEQLSALLNEYLDVMSDAVLDHGGTIDKFVGDAVVAFWGAPISRPDDADRSARAAVAMYEAGEVFARKAEATLRAAFVQAGRPESEAPKVGCTRVGLHFGEAVVGNFGGEGRIQYTALGDGMNTAARLESANKSLKTTALVSSEAKSRMTLDLFRPMGRVVLSGRATPVEVWEPASGMDEALRGRLNALWRQYDGGDRDALVQLEDIAAGLKEDAAVQEFVYRIREAGPGGHFVLASK